MIAIKFIAYFLESYLFENIKFLNSFIRFHAYDYLKIFLSTKAGFIISVLH
jgi:hypothetical protein